MALQKAGIVVGSGMNAGVTGTHQVGATVRELKLMVGGRTESLEAICAGTSQSAALLGLQDRGTVKRGRKLTCRW